MQAIKTTSILQWNRALWSQQKNLEKQFSFGDYVMWFPGNKSHYGNFLGNGLNCIEYSMCCQITLCYW